MNWWMLGCGAAVVAEIYTLYLLGTRNNENRELKIKNKMYEETVNLDVYIMRIQNSYIDRLIEKLPDKKDEPA